MGHGRTNIIVIMSDQHRRDTAGCYGHDIVKTPNMDRLCAAGCRFDMAYCQAPLCGPSRGAIQTGTHCHTARALGHNEEVPVRDDIPMMAEWFRDRGYSTGGFGKMHVIGESEERDLGYTERGLRYYTYQLKDYIDAVGEETVNLYLDEEAGAFNPKNIPVRISEHDMFDSLVVDRSIEFLQEHKNEPFFLFTGLEKPHPYWTAPPEFHSIYDPEKIHLPDDFGQPLSNVPESLHWWMEKESYLTDFSPEKARNIIAAYYANVSYMDSKLGQLLSSVEELGLTENTLIVYTSDHGEMLFDHTMLQKHNFFEGSVAVPLICSHPGLFPGGSASHDIVQLIDLFPTFCEAAGLNCPDTLEGESLLAGVSNNRTRTAQAAFSEFYVWGSPWRMVRTSRWKYIYQDTEIDQLYDMQNDPNEFYNLAHKGEYTDTLRKLKALCLKDWEIPKQEHMVPRHGMYPWKK